ncbi:MULTISPECIES: response regulator transcription factor [unclassified Coleofasciculus]|uniref:response regulator transcription factor n=1 Tax=unclassified Coleofasciculus TaxID=2692782 RepID=UPI00188250E5|nr:MULTISPECIES: response regulator [unclassified Coleofasciculus]MBE9127854.1 response regulator [Coleofasciculus sp. LEGE 07081]MBE9149626.1 response regulator [Coleofasciculus sp. LEGE 07092]
MDTALVVEDCLTQMAVLTDCLKQAGLNVVIAHTGEEALVKVRHYKPSVIVLDVVLPGISGFEICRELKTTAETKDIPIVLCSTKGSQMDKFWGMKQGADAYISKPVDQEELSQTVKRLIKY